MALTLPTPPKEALGLVRLALAKLRGQSGRSGKVLAKVSTGIAVAAPHARYTIKLSNIVKGRLDLAKLSGWRYIVLDGAKPLATANLSIKKGDRKFRFSHLSYGPFVKNTLKGIHRAEKLRGDYELRLLTVPGLNVIALWLRGKDDRLIPLPPTHASLKPFSIYSGDEFIETLKTAASVRLQSEKRLKNSKNGQLREA